MPWCSEVNENLNNIELIECSLTDEAANADKVIDISEASVNEDEQGEEGNPYCPKKRKKKHQKYGKSSK